MKVEIGKTLEVEVNVDALRKHESVMDHVIYIGLRNILMDSHAGITSKEYPDGAELRKVAMAVVEKKLEAMYDGTVRVARAGGRVSVAVDPIGAEALRLARVFIYGKARHKTDGPVFIQALRKALGMTEAVGDKDVLDEAIKRRAAREDVRAEAAKIVEAKAALRVDPADLGI